MPFEESLAFIKSLPKGWDGEDAVAVPQLTFELTRQIMMSYDRLYPDANILETVVLYPTLEGEIDLELMPSSWTDVYVVIGDTNIFVYEEIDGFNPTFLEYYHVMFINGVPDSDYLASFLHKAVERSQMKTSFHSR